MVRKQALAASRLLGGVLLFMVLVSAGGLLLGCSSSNKPSVFQGFEPDGTLRGFISLTGIATQPVIGQVRLSNFVGQWYIGRILDGTTPGAPAHPLGYAPTEYAYFEVQAPPGDYDFYMVWGCDSNPANPGTSPTLFGADIDPTTGKSAVGVKLWADEVSLQSYIINWPPP